jgi:predicted PurR-regulated permease PerM
MGLILGIPIVAVAKSVLEHMEPTRKLGLWLGD